MSSESPLTKRIKRHVIGRIRTYFAATSPGLENICLNELLALPLTNKAAAVISGGVEFQGRLQDCYLANLNLRSANRILMRIQTFKATNFSRLEKNIADIPWELYLNSEHLLKINVATRHCRLYHSGAISNRLLTSIIDRLTKTNTKEKMPDLSSAGQQIFIRGADDLFTISIDSSGDNLYKRGLKKYPGRAPLRENLAAAALLLAGYSGNEPLVDPMCGSGTFSLEGALMTKKIPPGWRRKFAFMHWPSFNLQQWEYLKRQAEKNFIQPQQPLIFASDKNPEICRLIEKCTIQFDLSDTIKVYTKDFFDLDPNELTDQPGVVSINPPYGRRIGTRKESTELLRAICARLNQKYKGWKLALFIPERRLIQFVPFEMPAYSFSHGGLKPTLIVGRIT